MLVFRGENFQKQLRPSRKTVAGLGYIEDLSPVPCRCRRFWRFCRQRKPGEHGDFYRLTPSNESSRLEMDAQTR